VQRPPTLDAHVEAIESAFVAHWSMFGGYPGASLHDEEGVLWYEGPLRTLPYNAVIRTRITGDADRVIERLRDRFRDRGAAFMWVVRPSDTPADLAHRLAAHGLDLVEHATGMDRDLATWPARADDPGSRDPEVTIVEAESGPALDHYEALIRTYWSVQEDERHHIEVLNRHWSGARSPGIRLVAYLADAPIGKLFVNLSQLPVVAIYGVAVRPAARGRGVATALMVEALDRALAAGGTSAVLHSSPMARSLYRRLGFVERCSFEVWATASLFGTHHH
jgi:ribosomal protein S18 acetylase RimI-like enzyme